MKKFTFIIAILMATVFTVSAQQIKGTVKDNLDGTPLVGASVVAKGTTTGSVTDANGAFEFTLPNGATTLVVSFVGYVNQEVTINGQTILSIMVENDAKVLSDVIVVGYGTQSQRDKVSSVSKIDGKDLDNMPMVGLQQMLQGQAPGIQVVSTSGMLGANAAVKIRGVGSISAGGNPLYVVDGVPLNDDSYSFALGSSTALNPLVNLNPNDIENVSVLKDASATAIYGSRGSNGVILITTKRGKAGKNVIGVDFYTGFSKPTYLLDMMTPDQYRGFLTDYQGATGLATTSYDWQKAVLQTGRINNYGVNLSGGTEKTQYYMGGSFVNQSNYSLGNTLDQLSGRLNFTHRATDWLQFGANISISRVVNDRIYSDNSTFAPLTAAYLQDPTIEPFDATGAYKRLGFIPNVLAIEKLAITDYKTRRTISNVFLNFNIMKGLSFKTDWGIDQYNIDETFRFPDIVSVSGSGERIVRDDNKWLTTNTLNYFKDFGKGTELKVVAGQSFESSQYEDIDVAGSGFAADGLRNVSSAATKTTTEASRSQWVLNSFFIRPTFKLSDKYIVEGAFRRDGSSRFGENNRFGDFWSVGGAYILSNEGFMKDVKFIQNLKIKASYGVVGNDRISGGRGGNFASLGLYSSGILSDYAGAAGLRPTQAANPDLKWEKTNQFDAGISFDLFRGRVGVEANYYNNNVSDLLLDFPLSEVSGLTSISRNVGKMRNSGLELALNTTNVETSGGFRWTTRFNISSNQNKVISLDVPGIAKDPEGNRFLDNGILRVVEGKTLAEFYLSPYIGINQTTGNAEWNGKTPTGADSIVTTVRAGDRRYVGSALPKFYGGMTNTFTYKGFELSAFLTFTYGNNVHLGELNFTENPANNSFNKSKALLNYWSETNKGGNATFPSKASASRNVFASNSTNQMLDGSYMRLRNVTLSYTLRGSTVGTKVFDNARIYVSGTNLWTLRAKGWEGRGQDPEVSDAGNSNTRQGRSFFTPPQAQTIQVGITANF
jgi:TonB-dependent starch-binding outer membrane protein SusC